MQKQKTTTATTRLITPTPQERAVLQLYKPNRAEVEAINNRYAREFQALGV